MLIIALFILITHTILFTLVIDDAVKADLYKLLIAYTFPYLIQIYNICLENCIHALAYTTMIYSQLNAKGADHQT